MHCKVCKVNHEPYSFHYQRRLLFLKQTSLCYCLKMTKLNRSQHSRFDIMERFDLSLQKDILLNLRASSIGRSFNSILRNVIKIVTISDACLFGMEGYFIVKKTLDVLLYIEVSLRKEQEN